MLGYLIHLSRPISIPGWPYQGVPMEEQEVALPRSAVWGEVPCPNWSDGARGSALLLSSLPASLLFSHQWHQLSSASHES